MLIAISFEILSLIQMILSPSKLGTPAAFFSTADGSIFWALSPLSLLLLISLLYYCPAIRVINWTNRHSVAAGAASRRIRAGFRIALSHILKTKSVDDQAKPNGGRIMLLVGILSSLVITYFPYRPDLNPLGLPVGIDAPIYTGWLGQILNTSPGGLLHYAFTTGSEGSRPLFILLLYLIAYLSNAGAETVVKFSPMILVPLLVIASYFFVQLGTGDGRRAGFTAVLTAFSPIVTVGMWATYYTNWLALAETFAFFGLLLAHLGSKSFTKELGLIALSLALLLTHPWTWILVSGVTSVFIASLRRDPNFWSGVKSLSYMLLSGISAAIWKTLEFGGFGLADAAQYVFAQTSNPLNQLLMFWPNVTKGLSQTYGGLLMNSIFLSLGFLAITRLRFTTVYDRLLIIWIGVASVTFLFAGSYAQTRIVFDLPIAVLASTGLAFVSANVGPKKDLQTLVLILIMVFNANYAIRSMIQL